MPSFSHRATRRSRGVSGVICSPIAADSDSYRSTCGQTPERSCTEPSWCVTVSDPQAASAASWMSSRVIVAITW